MKVKETLKETWKPVSIGGATGILMGAGAMYGAQLLMADETSVPEGGLRLASQHNDKSFKDAFDAARAEVGPGGVFRWHGNIYNTYTAEEWQSMSDQDRQLFAERVSPEIPAGKAVSLQQTATAEVTAPSSGAETEPDVAIAKDQNPQSDVDLTASADSRVRVASDVEHANADTDDDVRVIGFGDVTLPNGASVTVEELEVNGQRVAVIDVDKDGVGDLAMSDLNNNHRMDEGEVIDLETGQPVDFTNDNSDYSATSADATPDIDMMPV